MLTHDDILIIAKMIVYIGFVAVVFLCGTYSVITCYSSYFDGVLNGCILRLPEPIAEFLKKHPAVFKFLKFVSFILLELLYVFVMSFVYSFVCNYVLSSMLKIAL